MQKFWKYKGAMINMTREHSMVTMLEKLGVDFSIKEHTHYKFINGSFMHFVVETHKQNTNYPDVMFVSVSHYGTQNGDLMADPDMEFMLFKNPLFGAEGQSVWTIKPIFYRNDYVGAYRVAQHFDENGKMESVNRKELEEQRVFLTTWARNLKAQGFSKEHRVIEV